MANLLIPARSQHALALREPALLVPRKRPPYSNIVPRLPGMTGVLAGSQARNLEGKPVNVAPGSSVIAPHWWRANNSTLQFDWSPRGLSVFTWVLKTRCVMGTSNHHDFINANGTALAFQGRTDTISINYMGFVVTATLIRAPLDQEDIVTVIRHDGTTVSYASYGDAGALLAHGSRLVASAPNQTRWGVGAASAGFVRQGHFEFIVELPYRLADAEADAIGVDPYGRLFTAANSSPYLIAIPGAGTGVTVSVPSAAVTVSATAPSIAAGAALLVGSLAIAVAATAPSIATGAAVSVPSTEIAVSASAPTVAATGPVLPVLSAATLLFVSGTSWKPQVTAAYGQLATGGTYSVIDVGGVDYGLHVFESSGDFIVYQALDVEYLVVAGGGGGSGNSGFAVERGAGGGGGGLRKYISGEAGNSGAAALTLTPDAYTVTVGAGGAKNTGDGNGTSGTNSTLAALDAVGGGGGGGGAVAGANGLAGGSGGGAGRSATGGAGTPGQGFAGGDSSTGGLAGGGGAAGAGQSTIGNDGGNGGAGLGCAISGTAVGYAGGGGGGANASTHGVATDGGGNAGVSGTDGTGGGGGGMIQTGASGDGGDGIVIIRYPLS